MVWVKYKEIHHGKDAVFWEYKKSTKEALTDLRQWNNFNNPYDHLSIIGTNTKRPKGIKKTKDGNIYKDE